MAKYSSKKPSICHKIVLIFGHIKENDIERIRHTIIGIKSTTDNKMIRIPAIQLLIKSFISPFPLAQIKRGKHF